MLKEPYRELDLNLVLVLTMLFTAVASILLAGTTLAQSSTPSQFPIQVNKTLDVSFGTTSITPGLLVKKSSKFLRT